MIIFCIVWCVVMLGLATVLYFYSSPKYIVNMKGVMFTVSKTFRYLLFLLMFAPLCDLFIVDLPADPLFPIILCSLLALAGFAISTRYYFFLGENCIAWRFFLNDQSFAYAEISLIQIFRDINSKKVSHIKIHGMNGNEVKIIRLVQNWDDLVIGLREKSGLYNIKSETVYGDYESGG